MKRAKKHTLERTYRWNAILNQHKDDMYVCFVLKEAEHCFMKEHKISKIEGPLCKEYEKFLLDLSHSVVKAIDLAAHNENAGVRLIALGIYPKPIDKYVTIFYNALIGHEKKQKGTSNKISNQVHCVCLYLYFFTVF